MDFTTTELLQLHSALGEQICAGRRRVANELSSPYDDRARRALEGDIVEWGKLRDKVHGLLFRKA